MSTSYRISRVFFKTFVNYLDYIMFNLLFPGGLIYRLTQNLYIKLFDFSERQKLKNVTESDYQNPRIVGKKRLRMHSSYHSFLTKSQALEFIQKRRDISFESYFIDPNNILLTGKCGEPDESEKWKFTLVGSPELCPTDWEKRSFVDSNWFDVSLPNHWQLQSFDIPLYTNTSYPFQFDPPYTVRNGHWTNAGCDLGLGASPENNKPLHPNEPGPNSTGLFRKNFELPDHWLENKDMFEYFLIFEGVDSNLQAWLNDQELGYSQDSCLPCEFNVTDMIDFSHSYQLLSVKVSRWCDGSYLEDQDKWWLSGIYREISLQRKPKLFISDVEITAGYSLVKGKKKGKIRISLLIDDYNKIVGENDCFFSIDIYEAFRSSDRPLAQASGDLVQSNSFISSREFAENLISTEIADKEIPLPKRSLSSSLAIELEEPKLWTAESPKLYNAVITLFQRNPSTKLDQEIHTVSLRFGIRNVSIGGEDNTLNINEIPITLNGINRHEFDSKTGRAVSRKSMIKDALLLKRLGFNAVRSAHYPQHPFWLDLCDEVGLYVIDEANIETHGFQAIGQPIGYLSSLEEWRGAMLSRVSRMLERDKNHPCVIGWSLGNECGYGPTHREMYKWLKLRDPSRFVQYESGGARSDVTDIICPMYQRPKWCIEQSLTDTHKRPVILCEYAHAMGNSGGSLGHYWKYFRDQTYPRLQGGFIWDFADQGLSFDKPNEFKYGGDFGDYPNTHNFCCNGIVNPDRLLYPTAYEVAFLQSPVTVKLLFSDIDEPYLQLENRRNHIDTQDLTLIVTLKTHDHSFKLNYASFPSGTFPCGSILPGQSISIYLMDYFSRALAAHKKNFKYSSELESFLKYSQSESWLDVSLQQKINAEDIEITHFSLQSDKLIQYLRWKTQVMSEPLPPMSESLPGRFECFIDGSIELQDLPDKLVFIIHKTKMKIVISKVSGLLTEIVDCSNDVQILNSPIDICLYRAPTDNDRGGDIMSFESQWKAAGYHCLTQLKNHVIELNYQQRTDFVHIRAQWTLIPDPNKNITSGIEIPCFADYVLTSQGFIDVKFSIVPPSYLPPLPRIGVSFSLISTFDKVTWFGLGPHEAYEDRKQSAYLNIFSSGIDELHTPYVCPQESGRRADPRWILFHQSQHPRNLGVHPNRFYHDLANLENWNNVGYGFSASRYSLSQIIEAKHDYELHPEDNNSIFIHLDGKSMGLGGYDSWSPNVDKQYLIEPNNQTLEVSFRLFLSDSS